MALKFAVAPSPLSTLLENAPVLSEALLNKPVGCVLLPPWRWRCVVIYHFTRIYGPFVYTVNPIYIYRGFLHTFGVSYCDILLFYNHSAPSGALGGVYT